MMQAPGPGFAKDDGIGRRACTEGTTGGAVLAQAQVGAISMKARVVQWENQSICFNGRLFGGVVSAFPCPVLRPSYLLRASIRWLCNSSDSFRAASRLSMPIPNSHTHSITSRKATTSPSRAFMTMARTMASMLVQDALQRPGVGGVALNRTLLRMDSTKWRSAFRP